MDVFKFKKKIVGLKAISVNKAWRGGPRYRTAEYNDFKKNFALLLGNKHEQLADEELELKLLLGMPAGMYHKSDADNFLKPILDSLVECAVIRNDRFVKKITLEKYIAEDYMIEIELK